MKNKLTRVLGVKASELNFSLYMFFNFFLIITTFWILKPLKKISFIKLYDQDAFLFFNMSFSASEAELLAKTANLFMAIFAFTLFTKLSKKYTGAWLNVLISGILIVSLAGIQYLLSTGSEVATWAFYIYGDFFSTIMVASFFAYVNNNISVTSSKKLYGPIGLGGIIGGVVGTNFIRLWIKEVSLDSWLYICMGTIALVALNAFLASKHIIKNEESSKVEEGDEGVISTIDSMKTVFKSSYLINIAIILGLYEMVSTIMDFQLSNVVSHYFDGPQIGQFFTNIYAVTTWVSLFSQLVITNLVLRKSGPKTGLLILPILVLVTAIGFVFSPIAVIAGIMAILDNGLNYSVNQTSKEALYVPLGRTQKLKAKAFIDIFVMRFAKVLAIGLTLSLSLFFKDFESIKWLSLLTIVLSVLWVMSIRRIGKDYELMTGVKKPDAAKKEDIFSSLFSPSHK